MEAVAVTAGKVVKEGAEMDKMRNRPTYNCRESADSVETEGNVVVLEFINQQSNWEQHLVAARYIQLHSISLLGAAC